MAESSAGLYLKDGRLFESVFYNSRGGSQWFGFYNNSGTDIGQVFYAGKGSTATGYQNSSGTDIGYKFLDNTYASDLGGYISLSTGKSAIILPTGNGLRFQPVAHPSGGSGIYTYYWWLSAVNHSVFKDMGHGSLATSSSAPVINIRQNHSTWSNGTNEPLYEIATVGRASLVLYCRVTDGVTGKSVTLSATYLVRYAVSGEEGYDDYDDYSDYSDGGCD